MERWQISHIVLLILVVIEGITLTWFLIDSWKATRKANLYAQAEAIGRARVRDDG